MVQPDVLEELFPTLCKFVYEIVFMSGSREHFKCAETGSCEFGHEDFVTLSGVNLRNQLTQIVVVCKVRGLHKRPCSVIMIWKKKKNHFTSRLIAK